MSGCGQVECHTCCNLYRRRGQLYEKYVLYYLKNLLARSPPSAAVRGLRRTARFARLPHVAARPHHCEKNICENHPQKSRKIFPKKNVVEEKSLQTIVLVIYVDVLFK